LALDLGSAKDASTIQLGIVRVGAPDEVLGEPLAAVGHWVKLLVAADVVYLAVSLLTFDVVLEG